MNKTLIADVQRARIELARDTSILTQLDRTMHAIEDRSYALDDVPGSYEKPFVPYLLDANMAGYAAIRYYSAMCQLEMSDDVEFVLLCVEAVKEYVEFQSQLRKAVDALTQIRGDIKNPELLRLGNELLDALNSVPVDPLIQKIALESDADLKYVKHQHSVQFLPNSRIEVELVYDGVRLGHTSSHWVGTRNEREIVSSIIDQWPLVVWTNFAARQRTINQTQQNEHVISSADLQKILYIIENKK